VYYCTTTTAAAAGSNSGKSPNSITPTFIKTSPRKKSWTQIMKVADTNHLDMLRCLRQNLWQVRDKLFASLYWNSVRCNAWGKSATRSATKSADFVANTNHESQRHYLCRGLSWFVSTTFPAGKFW